MRARMAFGRVLVGAGDDEAREPPERRIVRLLAQLDLGRVERLAVRRDQRLHHRMLGLVRLQEADAAAFLAAGAADHLMQQLERALGGARIAVGEPEIGIDDADEVELREMVPLGDELRADDDVEAALRDVVELLAHALDRFRRDRWRARGCARPGNSSAASCSSRSTPGPTGAKDSAASHFGHLLRQRHREAAVMADQPPPEAMIDQPGVAVRAGEPVAAAAAERERRIAAAVEEQQRLLAALDRGLAPLPRAAAR